MTETLDQILVKDFPNLYRDRHGDVRNTCMAFGFECSNYWFELIYDLSYWLEKEAVSGYVKNISINDSVSFFIPPALRASQVKSKYGGLRFYVDGANDRVWDLIADYEKYSYKMCETCESHKANQVSIGSWVYTYCKPCEKFYRELRRSEKCL